MSPVRVSIRPVQSTQSVNALSRAMARFLVAAIVFFIFFAALFPFDFHFPRHGFWQEIARKFDSSPEPAVLEEKAQNVLFFVPFGYALACAIHARGALKQSILRVMTCIIAGLCLSLTVEVLQVFLGFRDPTWMDVCMNTLGALLGALVVVLVRGDRALSSLTGALARLRPYVNLKTVTVALLVYSLVQLLAPLLARDRGSLQAWDGAFPLLVGNEATGDRAWKGTVRQVDLASRAATREEVAQIHAAGTARDVLRDALAGSYQTVGPAPYLDASGLLKPLNLVWPDPRQTVDPPPAGAPAHVNDYHWLRTQAGIAPATFRIRATSQFTLVANITPDEAYQQGPARIVSISGGIYVRNVTIMHERHLLAIRLRTPLLGPDGSAPELRVEDVFESTKPRQIVLTYADPLLVVYVDGMEQGRMEIVPEAALIWRLYPRSGWRVKLTQYGGGAYAAVYRILVFVPFAALLVAATALSGRAAKVQLAIIAAAILLMAVLLEIIIGSMTTSGFQIRNLLISLIVAGISVAAVRGLGRSTLYRSAVRV